MKISMFSVEGRNGIGLWREGRLYGFMEGDASYPGDLDTILARGEGLAAAGEALGSAPELDSSRIRYLPPLQRPSKILCSGLNYRDHAEETGMKLPEWPAVFARFASCLVGHGEALLRPQLSEQFDYEGELAFVIGKKARSVRKADALSYVAAYSIFNDASLRDWQLRASQWTLGKNFDATGGFGPWLVTPDELAPGAEGLRLRTQLNGLCVQDGNTANMVFGVASLIEILSQAMTLMPGDLVITGTPAGVGFTRKPPLFMKPGDLCEVEIEGIGMLRNTVGVSS
ncbi:MAG TPA: 5-oxopent-3-ene-1,2,5-tricarboxylate decarboxylase [Spirochaetaceae bacterium]|jgi:2-keto-4-pentenoate hydratase/2-oxohepta-3-ene-1,7-dioic acid hydratase in catechol pathway|nr:5-oxopent-3-ene-1,2,5-tricarboxylate decarboxylase [Spirochaetaceae bacterium]